MSGAVAPDVRITCPSADGLLLRPRQRMEVLGDILSVYEAADVTSMRASGTTALGSRYDG